jgi:hypothetical protein
MGSTSKGFSLLLVIVLAVSSLIIVESAFAQSIPKPSVPEFTAKLISSPPESQPVNRTIELSIKNQPSFSDYGFFYMVRARINHGNWSLLYTIDNVPHQSDGEYTTFSYPSDQPVVEYQYYLGDGIKHLFPGDKVDFQVQAMVGSIHRVFNSNFTNQLDMYPYVFTGETSDWSNTQTITIGETSASPSPNPTPTPTVPELSSWTILLLLTITLALAGLLVYNKKQPETNTLEIK